MYKSFEIRNFRCFRELVLAPIERFNLVAGVNNVGKTALLEAVFLHSGAYNPALSLKVSAFRGIETVKLEPAQWAEAPWNSLFNQFEISRTIELTGEDTTIGRRSILLRALRQPADLARIRQPALFAPTETKGVPISLDIVNVLELECKDGDGQGAFYMIVDAKGIRTEPIPPNPPFQTFFQGARMRVPFIEEAERFGELDIHGKQDVLLGVLKLIEPRLKRLAIVVSAGQPILHGDIGMGRLVPLPLMGEGMVRLATLVLHIGNARRGVVLVDEIENGLHHSILIKVWQAIAEAAREFDTQVFATTHSLECIVAAHKAFAGTGKYDFRLHRLEQTKDGIRAVTYDQEALAAAIEVGLEVR